MTLDEMKALPLDKQKALIAKVDAARKKGKATNYSATYGAGGATIARAAGVSEHEGKKLHEAYWRLNWSIPAIADGLTTKTCRRQKWLYNPVSRLWYSLRTEKDRWSTLNQGTGVWCFDTWVKYQRQKGLPQIGQMHDETINLVKEKNKDKAAEVLRWAIEETNKELKLNRELDIDVAFGLTYADIH